MGASINDEVRALLDGPNFCFLSTLTQDGSPHVVAVWAGASGDEVVLNSAEHRAWLRHLRRDPRAALVVQNAEDPYEFAHIRGRCSELTRDGADEHIDFLARKYLGVNTYPLRAPGEQRNLIRIRPERVFHFAGPSSLTPPRNPS